MNNNSNFLHIFLEKFFSLISFESLIIESKISWNTLQIYIVKAVASEINVTPELLFQKLSDCGALQKARNYMNKFKFDNASGKYDVGNSNQGEIYHNLKKIFKECL